MFTPRTHDFDDVKLGDLPPSRARARFLSCGDRDLFYRYLEDADLQQRAAEAKDARVAEAAAIRARSRENARRERLTERAGASAGGSRPWRNTYGGGATCGAPRSSDPSPRLAPAWAYRCLERASLQAGPPGLRDAVAKASRTAQRRRALGWVSSLDTRTGTPRAVRIALCGQAVARGLARGDGTVVWSWAPEWCRDRACPACAFQRSKQIAHALRAHRDARVADGHGRLLFVTFTQTKAPAHLEGPGAALDRLQRAWVRCRERADFRRWVAGGVKAVECVWSARAEDGPRYDGWHAHLHLAMELRDDAPWDVERALVDMWLAEARRESGPLGLRVELRRGQKVLALDDARVGQVAKYVTKPFELPDRRAPRFFRETSGRRLIDGWGTWRRFRRAVEPPQCRNWLIGPTLSELALASREQRSVVFAPAYNTKDATWVESLKRTRADAAPFDPANPRHRDHALRGLANVVADIPIAKHRARIMGQGFEVNPTEVWRGLRRDPRPAYEIERELFGGAGPPAVEESAEVEARRFEPDRHGPAPPESVTSPK